jgi:hypothetical protein
MLVCYLVRMFLRQGQWWRADEQDLRGAGLDFSLIKPHYKKLSHETNISGSGTGGIVFLVHDFVRSKF